MSMPPTSGRRSPLAVITGAANGLGLEASRQLGRLGFDLILVDRDTQAGRSAQSSLRQDNPEAKVDFVQLDLSDLDAIQSWSRRLQADQVDVLLNNAGLFPSFERRSTEQNCELGLAVGLYGHFALTAALLPRLLAAPAPRVVTVSSIAHAAGVLDPNDPLLAKDYDANRAYSACKLACLLFARELQAQATAHHSPLLSLAAHPGISRTRIGQYAHNPATHWRHHAIHWATRLAMRLLGQDAQQGAMPLVYAATHAHLAGGQFIGPGGLFQFKGPPKVVRSRAATLLRHDSAAIWRMAEEYTQMPFDWNTAREKAIP